MEYIYAVRLLAESGRELNERNLTAVLEAVGCSVSESRVKALVAALEGVDLDDTGVDSRERDVDGPDAVAPTSEGQTPEE